MMGVAGENVVADHVDTLDLFHTMEAYFTWYPSQQGGTTPLEPPAARTTTHGSARDRSGQ